MTGSRSHACGGHRHDDAIIVLEEQFPLHGGEGRRPGEAAIEGTREIGLAVTADHTFSSGNYLPAGKLHARLRAERFRE